MQRDEEESNEARGRGVMPDQVRVVSSHFSEDLRYTDDLVLSGNQPVMCCSSSQSKGTWMDGLRV